MEFFGYLIFCGNFWLPNVLSIVLFDYLFFSIEISNRYQYIIQQKLIESKLSGKKKASDFRISNIRIIRIYL